MGTNFVDDSLGHDSLAQDSLAQDRRTAGDKRVDHARPGQEAPIGVDGKSDCPLYAELVNFVGVFVQGFR